MKRKQIALYLLFLSITFMMSGKQSQKGKIPLRDFGFGVMEIFNFSNLTSNLLTEDLNSDGLDDILFLNNQVSRLEILIRKKSPHSGEKEFPALDERFNRRGIVLDNWVQFFQVRNINEDNRPDIVTLDEQQGIQIYFQLQEGIYTEPVSLFIKEPGKLRGFECADLNGDSHIDILAYRQENAEILRNDGRGKFKSRTKLDFSSYGCGGALPADVNGDKIADLLFYFPKEKLPLRIRTGKGQGKFGWEEALSFPDNRVIEKVDLTGAGNCQLAMILKNGLILRLYEFVSREGATLFDKSEAVPVRLPLKGVGRKNPPTWAAADIDRDGYEDFCAAAPLLSQIHLYKGSAAGLSYSPVTIDSLRNIKTLAITGSGDVVVFSEAEKTIALHRNENLSAFPQSLKAPGEPAAVAVDSESTIFALYKDKNITLNLFDARDTGSAPFASYEPGIRDLPQAMKAFPLDGEKHWLVMLFMPYSKPRMYRLYEGKISELTAEHFQVLGSVLKPGAVTAIGTEKRQVLLVAEGNVARLYHWNQDRFVVAGQLNPRVESARLTAGCRLSTEEGFLLYDDAGQDIYHFLPGPGNKVNRIHISDGIFDLAGFTTLRLKKNRGILLIGQDQVQWLQDGAPSLQLRNAGEYVTKTEKPDLWDILSVSLGSPGRPMVALLDAKNGSIELVGMKDGKLVEELVFKVFQDPGFGDRFSEKTYEPHDLASGDVNGDNIRDLLVLVHDKLIIYLGE